MKETFYTIIAVMAMMLPEIMIGALVWCTLPA